MNQPNYLDVPHEFPPTWASAYGQDRNGYWLEITVHQQTLCFRWIPQGKFTMGSAKDEEGRFDDEDLHVVSISRGFWLADTVVTQALWQAVMAENPSHFQESTRDDLPVEQVSWDDAQAFIAKIHADYPALNLRLPWDAEWEYACRAGTTSPFTFGNNITPEQVNYDGGYPYAEAEKGLNRKKTVVVKSLPANAWGLYEVHGNVWEWCADIWQEHLGGEAQTDPWLNTGEKTEKSEVDDNRVIRGGSWNNFGERVRSAVRLVNSTSYHSYSTGFRLARSL